MKMRRIVWLALVLIALTFGAGRVSAGGMVVSLDQQPAGVVVDRSFTVGFMIRSMHDGQPLSDLAPQVVATLGESDQGATVQVAALPASNVASDTELLASKQVRLVFKASNDGRPGHYIATLTLPAPGEWAWEVQPFGAQESNYPSSLFTPLMVLTPEQEVQRSAVTPGAAPGLSPWLPLGLAAALGAVLLVARRRRAVRT